MQNSVTARTVCFKYQNTAETQDKDFKIEFINAVEVLKEHMNKSINEIYVNTDSRTVKT